MHKCAQNLMVCLENNLFKQAKLTGINFRSPLHELRYFQVTKCFPQDVMHVLLEGVVPTEFTLFLNHALEKKYTSPSQSLIQKLKISTTATMNGRINRVQFKKRPFKGLKKLDRMLVKCVFFQFYCQYLLHPQFQ